MARRRMVVLMVAMSLVAASCAGQQTGAESGTAGGGTAEIFHPDGWAGVAEVPTDVYDPVEAGEPLPEGYRQILQRDGIAPVYLPSFLRRDEVDWPDDELIIGVDLEGEARAYPVGFLNRREIVVDIHRGIPTFVTW